MKTYQHQLPHCLARLTIQAIFCMVFVLLTLPSRTDASDVNTDPTLWIVDDVTNTVYEVLVVSGVPTVQSSLPIPSSADSEIAIAHDSSNDTLWGVNESFGEFYNFSKTEENKVFQVISLCDVRGENFPNRGDCKRGPEGIAVDFLNDTLWAVDDPPPSEEPLPPDDGPKVYNFTKDGTLINSFTTSTFDPNSVSPQGIATDPFDGTLWITDNTSDLLYHVTANGQLLASFSTRTLEPQATNPQGISVDTRNGGLWQNSPSFVTQNYKFASLTFSPISSYSRSAIKFFVAIA